MTYKLDAGRCIVKDGRPFATIHGVRVEFTPNGYDPVELDQFAKDIVRVLNADTDMVAALRSALTYLGSEATDDSLEAREVRKDINQALALYRSEQHIWVEESIPSRR